MADAVKASRADAPKPIAVEVVRLWADLDPRGRLKTYRATVKVAYHQRVAL